MIDLKDIEAARELVGSHIHRTPTVRSRSLSERLGTNVYLKLELFQKSGSFKPRGVFNHMLQLTDEQREVGAVGFSGGNFAQALAYAGKTLGVRAHIFMPEYTPKNYIEATRAYGAEIELAPSVQGCIEGAEQYRRDGWTFIHPFDDPLLKAGHGTLGLELIEDVPELTHVFVSIGGGGLMSGVASAIKAINPAVRIWGVETQGADAMTRALDAGSVVEIQVTSLAKTLGAPFVSVNTLNAAQQLLEGVLVVSDEEAFKALRFILERAKVLTELAASCTLAGATRARDQFTDKSHIALILCGGNVSVADLSDYRKRFGSSDLRLGAYE